MGKTALRVEDPQTPGAGAIPRWPAFTLVVLVQWPLAAALLPVLAGRPASTSDLLGLATLAAGAAVWLWFALRSRAPAALLAGALLATLGAFLCLRNDGLLVFTLFAALLWLVSSIQLAGRGSQVADSLALSVAAVFLCLLAAELLLGWLAGRGESARSGEPRIAGGSFSGQIEVRDRQATAQLLPMSRARARKVRSDGEVEFDVVYRIDRFGSRAVPGRPPTGPAWMLFGGSFAFGEGLEDDQTIASSLQELAPEIRVFNFAIRNSSAADVLLLLQRKVASGETPAGVVYFFIEDHLRRTALPAYTVAEQGFRPRFELVDGEATYVGKAENTIPGRGGQLHVNLTKRSHLYRRLQGDWLPTAESLELVAALARAMKSEVEAAANGRFLFVFLPQRESRWPDQVAALRSRLEGDGVKVLDCQALMKEHLEAAGATNKSQYLLDGHPNGSYARLVARWLHTRLDALGWIAPAPDAVAGGEEE